MEEEKVHLSFVDFIQDARSGPEEPENGLEKGFNDALAVAREQNDEKILHDFFKALKYTSITPPECRKMMDMCNRADFHCGPKY
jgi:hypothetical protein